MIFSLFPAAVFAEETVEPTAVQDPAPQDPEKEPEKDPAVCTVCSVKCTGDSVNPDCPVCGADISKCAGVEDGEADEPEKEEAESTCTCEADCTEAPNAECPV